MLGDHGFLSHSLLTLGRRARGPERIDDVSTVATEQCDLRAVEEPAAARALVSGSDSRVIVRPRKRKKRDAAADERRMVQLRQKHIAEDAAIREKKQAAKQRLGQMLAPMAKVETLSAYDELLQKLIKDRPPVKVVAPVAPDTESEASDDESEGASEAMETDELR